MQWILYLSPTSMSFENWVPWCLASIVQWNRCLRLKIGPAGSMAEEEWPEWKEEGEDEASKSDMEEVEEETSPVPSRAAGTWCIKRPQPSGPLSVRQTVDTYWEQTIQFIFYLLIFVGFLRMYVLESAYRSSIYIYIYGCWIYVLLYISIYIYILSDFIIYIYSNK